MIVTIFGSSIPAEGEKEFNDAFKLGKFLGVAGISICCGGYQGIMNAVSKGAAIYNVERIGVLVKIFNAVPSEYLSKKIICKNLYERLDNLISLADAFITLPGGTGTMLELSLVWELMNKNLITEKPIACVGKMWQRIVETMEERTKIEKRKTGLIKCFEDVDSCAEFIISSLKKK